MLCIWVFGSKTIKKHRQESLAERGDFCSYVVNTWVTKTPSVYISSSLPSDKLLLTFSLLALRDWAFLFFFSVFISKLCFHSMLNEGIATLGCAVTNWHRGGRWWWGGGWLSCHSPQRHELISVPLSNHTRPTCVILTLYTHTHTNKLSSAYLLPCASVWFPSVSMMCAVEVFAYCRRVFT